MHTNSKSSARSASQESRKGPRGLIQKLSKLRTKLKQEGAEDVWITALIGIFDEMPKVAVCFYGNSPVRILFNAQGYLLLVPQNTVGTGTKANGLKRARRLCLPR